ncbi:hypothetical protein [Hahella sp. CCB-MM4]|uniref:hypothetical protein n=1 Tax=Hahella sp. (strain CCB-MM4) TaxID=1926491 RepID=UPI001AF00712|nr:hypothetical protein [Hahella sp. CCB-MM4]
MTQNSEHYRLGNAKGTSIMPIKESHVAGVCFVAEWLACPKSSQHCIVKAL